MNNKILEHFINRAAGLNTHLTLSQLNCLFATTSLTHTMPHEISLISTVIDIQAHSQGFLQGGAIQQGDELTKVV